MFTPTPQQLARLSRLIPKVNKVFTEWRNSGLYEESPNNTSLERELNYISENRYFNMRIKQLESVLESEAGKPVTRYGIVVPKFMRDEIVRGMNMENPERAKLRMELYPEWGSMTSPEKAEILSNKNLNELYEEDYYSADMFDSLMEEIYPNMPKKAQIYIDVWLDNNGDEETASKIMEIAENNPEGFKRLMESPDIEKDIEYIYPDTVKNATRHNYKRGSAYKEESVLRIEKAEEYWNEMYDDYLNNRGYFHD